jgi:SAM-dependent methyltransferase
LSVRSSKARATALHWSQYEPRLEATFFGFPPLRTNLIATAFGPELAAQHAENRWWAEDIVCDLYLRERPIHSVLSLCCGFGAIEQHIVDHLGTVTDCLAVDIAPGAVAEAAARAAKADLDKIIRYEVVDLNEWSWGPDSYDLVIASGALHHLARVEDVLDGVKRCLRPGGVLYANEHIGARYSDFPPRQFELINAAAYLVPPQLRSTHALRVNPFANPYLRRIADVLLGNRRARKVDHPEWTRSTRALAAVLRTVALRPRAFGPLVLPRGRALRTFEPSEGVASDRIVDNVNARFPETHMHPYGGALLTYALDPAFYTGYDEGNATHATLLHTLCDLESFFVETGELPREHAIIVAMKDPDGTEEFAPDGTNEGSLTRGAALSASLRPAS